MLLVDLPTEILQAIASRLRYVDYIALRWTCHDLHRQIPMYGMLVNETGVDNTKLPPYHMRDLDEDELPPYTMGDLLAIEMWAPFCSEGNPGIDDDYFACSTCLKIKSASQFTNAMMYSKKGKKSPYRHFPDTFKTPQGYFNGDRYNRICLPCGMWNGTYRPGMKMKYGRRWNDEGGIGFVCGTCRGFHPGDPAVVGECRW